MYTSTISIVGITSFIVQLFTKVHCHCKESECDCSCYERFRQAFFRQSIVTPIPTPALRRMEPLAQ